MPSPPESPPVPPVIPVGIATKIGYIVGSGFAAVAAITTVLDGDLTPETVTTAILSALTFITLMGGRYFQAGKLYGSAVVVSPKTPPHIAQPVMGGTMTRNEPELDEVEIPPPSDEQLVAEGVLDPEDTEGPIIR